MHTRAASGLVLLTLVGMTSCDNPRKQYQRGEQLLSKGKIEEAILCFDKAIRERPEIPYGYASKGVCYFHLKRDEEAAALLQQAIDLGDEDARTYRHLAFIHGLKGENDVAAELLTASIEEHPQDAESHFMRAAAYYSLQRNADALVDIERTLELRPQHLKARWLRAEVYFDNGAIESALEELDAHVEMRPDDPQASASRTKFLAALTNANHNQSQQEAAGYVVDRGGFAALNLDEDHEPEP